MVGWVSRIGCIALVMAIAGCASLSVSPDGDRDASQSTDGSGRWGVLINGLNKTYTCYAASDWACALAQAQQTAELASAHGQYDIVWRAQLVAGEALLAKGKTEQAIDAYEAAQAAINAASGTLSLDKIKPVFEMDSLSGITNVEGNAETLGKAQLTARLVGLHVNRQDYANAFVSAELGRARAFVDLLADTELAFNDNKATNNAVRSLDQEILSYRVKLAMASEAERPAIQSLIDQAHAKRQGIIDRIAKINPEWAAAYVPRATTLSRVQAALSEGDLLAYALPSENPTEVNWLLVTNKRIEFKRIAQGIPMVQRAFEALGDAIALQAPSEQEQVLSQLTIDLGLSQWPSAKQIFVVPQGLLHWLPWGGMLPGQALSVLPNASWLDRQPTPALQNNSGGALVVGDPAFGGILSQLPGAREEAIDVAAMYQAQALVGEKAQRQTILEAGLKRGSVLHLATHGTFQSDRPMQSALYLSSPAGRATKVTAQDLFENPMRAHTVVLSACETALGKSLPDNDVIGLQRSFLINGAQAVVSSLWTVNDAGVAQVMEDFHAIRAGQMGSQGNGKATMPNDSQNGKPNINHTNESQALALAIAKAKRAGMPPSVYGAFVLTGHVPVR